MTDTETKETEESILRRMRIRQIAKIKEGSKISISIAEDSWHRLLILSVVPDGWLVGTPEWDRDQSSVHYVTKDYFLNHVEKIKEGWDA